MQIFDYAKRKSRFILFFCHFSRIIIIFAHKITDSMEKNIFAKLIASALNLQERAVANTLALLEEGCTIPFISRYRKERTGGLDEVQIAAISDRFDKLQEIQKRKETVVKTITEQEKMTPELQSRIGQCWDTNELEDIYLPYKPKRRTRAQVAREQGLEPLAQLLMLQRERDPERAAERFVKGDVKDAETALKGAQDIIAETVSEDERSRQQLRNAFSRQAVITSKVVKAKADTDEAAKYSDYFDWQEPLKRCSSHRLLAMRRGEDEGILRISISPNDEEAVDRLKRHYVYGNTPCGQLVSEAIDDGYKRLLKPAIETEFAASSKEKADEEAIRVFAENLRQLLLGAPLGQKRVMGVDPGIRPGTACYNPLHGLFSVGWAARQTFSFALLPQNSEVSDTFLLTPLAISTSTSWNQ